MRVLSEPAKGHLAMLCFSGLVAGSFSLGVMIANEIEPAALTLVRFIISGALVGVVCLVGPGLRRAHFRAPWRYLVIGGIFAAYFVLMFEGLKTASPVSASAVFTLTPVMSALFAWLLLRQVTTPRMALALAIGAAGALWVIFRADLAALLAFEVGRGEAVYFVGCVAHAVYPALVRRFNRGEPAVVFTFGMMSAAVVVLLFYGWGEVRETDWAALPPLVWVVTAYLAIFASATTFVLLQYAALRLPSAKVMAYTYLTPSVVILWEMALGRGAPAPLVGAGVGLSVLALWLLLRDDEARAASRAIG